MFGRRGRGSGEGDERDEGDAPDVEAEDELEDELEDEPEDELDDEADGDAPRAAGRPDGPWDVADAPDDEVARLDLGAVRVPGLEGAEIQVNLDEETGQLMAVSVVQPDSALQLQVFAAPRNEATWPQVRQELAAQITRDGGLADVDETAGDLRAQLPFPQPDGSVALGAVRFVGVDGPRWLLRGVLSGRAAAEPAAAEPLLGVLRGVVVVRGGDPYAPGDPLPLRLPDQPGGGDDQHDEPDRIDISGTGQQITETR